jgi:hypothetical protein
MLWVLPAALAGVAWLVLPRDLPPGQCGGIGFGCTLSPADTALLLAALAAGPLLVLGLAGVLVVALVQGVRARQGAREPAPGDPSRQPTSRR